jgi:L-2-hydroxyglutarate oxidase LhgO
MATNEMRNGCGSSIEAVLASNQKRRRVKTTLFFSGLPSSKNDIVRHLIYPIPDPDLPFLGVHLTRMMDGSVTVGPNAVLGFAREGYPKFSFNLHDVAEYSTFPGFWKTMLRNICRSVLKS